MPSLRDMPRNSIYWLRADRIFTVRARVIGTWGGYRIFRWAAVRSGKRFYCNNPWRNSSRYTPNPNPRLIHQAAAVLRGGGVVVYPTDSCYALGCHLDDKDAVSRIRQIRQLDEQ